MVGLGEHGFRIKWIGRFRRTWIQDIMGWYVYNGLLGLGEHGSRIKWIGRFRRTWIQDKMDW